jgi:large subunit ribosomal protein L4
MEVSVYNIKGEETGKKVQLAEGIFGIEPNDHAIYLDAKQYHANQRQGTHKSKEKSEIVGSTRKLKKQKGTGTARAGSIKSPIFRGGGRIFGPKPRDYSFKLNKKQKQIARKSALSYKMKGENLRVLEDFEIKAPKTKEYLSILNSLELNGTKSLLVLSEENKNIVLSSKNIPKAKVTTARTINTYDILNADQLVIVEGALKVLEENLN